MKRRIRTKSWGAAALLVAAALALGARADEAPGVQGALAAFMERAAAEGFTGAVVVARDGRVLLEAGYGLADPDDDVPVTKDTVFTTGSITKQFTAAAVLDLEEEGKLSVSDPITKYFEGVPPDKRGITLHHLLTHQAGFPGAIGDDVERVGRDEYVRRALATELRFPPGEGYDYSNVGYSLAAAVVEIVSGRPYEAHLRERLFEPAGMAETGYVLPAWKPSRLAHGVTDDGGDWGTVVERALSGGGPGWHLLGNGGIHSTVGDMLRWHRALQGDGILGPAAKAKMYARHADEGGGTWYGYGWSVEPTPWGEMVTHNGGNPYYFADFLRFLEDDVVVYYTTTSRDRRMHRLGRPLAEIVFTGEVPELEPRPGPLTAAGPAAPAGSPAAKWGLPGSYRGQRAAELLEAIVTEDAAHRRAFVESALAPEMVERRSVEGLVEILGSLQEEAGEFGVRGVRPAGENRVEVVLDRKGRPAPMSLILELEPEEPHRILSIEVRVGD